VLGVRRAGTYGVRIAENTIAYARGIDPSGAVIPAAILSGNHLRLRVDCTGFYGCSVKRIVVTLRRGRHTVIARGAHGHARLTGDGRTILRRRGRIAVRVTATITDAAGRREHRATQLVLHD
jgi:hypothetical protein